MPSLREERAERVTRETGTDLEVVRTLVVRCRDWPVLALDPGLGLADEPVAVVHANRVVAASAAARAEGVDDGQRRREAQGRCPGLVVVDHDPDRDARAFQVVAAAVEAFSPRIEISRPGVCAVATRGPSRYFGGDEVLAAQVRRAGRGGPVRAGAGGRGRPGSGWPTVRSPPTWPPAAAGSASALVVPPGATPAFLAPQPVRALTPGLARAGLQGERPDRRARPPRGAHAR